MKMGQIQSIASQKMSPISAGRNVSDIYNAGDVAVVKRVMDINLRISGGAEMPLVERALSTGENPQFAAVKGDLKNFLDFSDSRVDAADAQGAAKKLFRASRTPGVDNSNLYRVGDRVEVTLKVGKDTRVTRGIVTTAYSDKRVSVVLTDAKGNVAMFDAKAKKAGALITPASYDPAFGMVPMAAKLTINKVISGVP
jgi:hypothetical protein